MRGQTPYQLMARGSATSKPSRCKSGFSWRRSSVQSGEVAASVRLQVGGAGGIRGEMEATMPVAMAGNERLSFVEIQAKIAIDRSEFGQLPDERLQQNFLLRFRADYNTS